MENRETEYKEPIFIKRTTLLMYRQWRFHDPNLHHFGTILQCDRRTDAFAV